MMTSDGNEELPTLQDFLRRPPWMGLAACAGQPIELFFPHRGVRPATMARAKEICSDCPTRAQCLDYASADSDIMGLWGGTSERERRTARHDVA